MMTKMLLAAAFIATVVVVPADAGITRNGKELNGRELNGSGLNGLPNRGLNGIDHNGFVIRIEF